MSPLDSPSSNPPRVLFWSYDPGVASFRHRLRPVVEELRRRGWRCEVEALPKGSYFRRVRERRQALAEADLLVLAKLNLGMGEDRALRRHARLVSLDVDDAIYLRQPRNPGEAADVSCVRLARFGRTAAACALVTAGNRRLAHMAERFAPRVEVVPTTVRVGDRPPSPPAEDGARRGHTLVWIGLPNNLTYLEPIRPALARLALAYPDLRLRVISSDWPDWDDVPVERVEWSEEVEEAAMAGGGIGLMPLTDDAWSRSKCAFKLLQYMAVGLPCVASPVGANRRAVVDGETGFLAAGIDEWHDALDRLLSDRELRHRMGEAGWRHARRHYRRRDHVRRHADLYQALVGGAPG